MHESLRKFQQLLRELFQFDSADLDFGIYDCFVDGDSLILGAQALEGLFKARIFAEV